MFGDGRQTRSFCYVDDLIRGIIALAESGEHEPVNIGNPAEFTLLELAESVITVTARARDRPRGAADRRPQAAPAGHHGPKLLGWEPEIELREGLQRTIDQAGIDVLVGASR